MTFVVFVMHEAKKKTMTKKICLIFKIFLVTSAISSAFIFSMYLGIYSNLQRICQADPSA